jgi:tRNA G46 methylase TrmB
MSVFAYPSQVHRVLTKQAAVTMVTDNEEYAKVVAREFAELKHM